MTDRNFKNQKDKDDRLLYMYLNLNPLTIFVISLLSPQFIWLFSVSQMSPVTYGTYQYPTWAILFGWFLGLCSLLPVPICAVIQIVKAEGTLKQVHKHSQYMSKTDTVNIKGGNVCICIMK